MTIFFTSFYTQQTEQTRAETTNAQVSFMEMTFLKTPTALPNHKVQPWNTKIKEFFLAKDPPMEGFEPV